MENLTKQQIILLTLLVSFVTSIATGIVTVALMNQAPVGVVQTINRVVEKTIETVTPSKETQTVVKETVLMNPEEQIVAAVEKNSKSLVRIYRTSADPSLESNAMVFVGLGAVVTDDGIIVTDNSLIFEGGNYFIATVDNKLLDLSIVKDISGKQISLLKIKDDEKNPIKFPKVSISNGNLKLGQTVIYLGGEKKDVVSTGIVSGLSVKEIKPADGSTSTPIQTKVAFIETSISSSLTPGGLLLNLSGELIGIKSIYNDSPRSDFFAPSIDIQEALASLKNTQERTQ